MSTHSGTQWTKCDRSLYDRTSRTFVLFKTNIFDSKLANRTLLWRTQILAGTKTRGQTDRRTHMKSVGLVYNLASVDYQHHDCQRQRSSACNIRPMSAARRAPRTEKAIYINRGRRRALRPLSDILGCRIDADPTPLFPGSTVRGVTDVGGGEIAQLRWNCAGGDRLMAGDVRDTWPSAPPRRRRRQTSPIGRWARRRGAIDRRACSAD